MVSIGTFSWKSLSDLRVHPWESSIVMVATVIVTVLTHDLAQGVAVGVLLSGIFFARKAARIFRIASSLSDDGRTRTYVVTGEIFFASAEAFVDAFDLREAIERVVIDVSGSHVWDLTAVAAIDRVILKFRREGTEAEILGLNQASSDLLGRLARHDKPGAADAPATH
jgi:sulfate permease, SulP family